MSLATAGWHWYDRYGYDGTDASLFSVGEIGATPNLAYATGTAHEEACFAEPVVWHAQRGYDGANAQRHPRLIEAGMMMEWRKRDKTNIQ